MTQTDLPNTTYRTPTRAVDVVLTLSGGKREEVCLYLSTVAETHAGPESLDEALNRDRDFLPVRARETEQTFLVRRSAIATIAVGDVDPELLRHPDAPTCVDLVQLQLDSGETVEGTLATVLPPGTPRLSDYFNFDEPAFVPLAVDDGVLFVNRDHISIVWL